jgi:hypothetical protein
MIVYVSVGGNFRKIGRNYLCMVPYVGHCGWKKSTVEAKQGIPALDEVHVVG